MNSPISLDAQLKCVQRELALRRNVYRGWVARGRMTAQQSDQELAAMAAVQETLQRLIREHHEGSHP